jgi:aryl-alcohol dehydrogenase-like predicted oxidoreductase
MEVTIIPGLREKISRIGFGCAAIGGYDYGRVDDSESIAAIHAALDSGINFFDTADVYGFGHSEEVLGRALSERGGNAVVATKVGVRWSDTGKTSRDTSPSYIRRAVEASLRRLRRDRIDLYQIHWPDPQTPLAETVNVLTDLVAEGKIRAFGSCNFDTTILRSALMLNRAPNPSLSTSQLSINVGDRTHVSDAADAHSLGLTTLAYNVLAQGLYGGKYGRESRFTGTDLRRRSAMFDGSAFDIHLRVLERLRSIGETMGAPPSQVAIRWALDASPVDIALVGLKRPSQVADAVRSSEWKLPSTAVTDLASLEVIEEGGLNADASPRNRGLYGSSPTA